MPSAADGSPVSLPLRYRLPNPPPLFVGRAEEAERLRAMILRAPVSVVWGLGGLGKTALVLHTLHHAFPEQASRTLFIGLRPAEPPGVVQVEIMRAIAAASGLARVDWSGLLDDPDALLATLLDRTEARADWVVLDDLHHADARGSRDVLAALTRYARKTRWIVTSRVDPTLPELADQTLFLGGMSHADLYQLAARCAQEHAPVELRQATDAAAGSPWRLRQLLAGGAPRSAEGDLLHAAPPEAVPLLEALAVLDLPLSPTSLGAIVPLPPPDVLDALERRGIVERSSGGMRLHDVARPLFQDREGLRLRKSHAASALAHVDDPLATLEALRLLLGLGRYDEAVALLEARCELVLAAGLAPRLSRLIEPLEGPRFARFRLRCAVELGDPAALDAATLPDPPTLKDRFLWALSRFVRGHIAETAPVAAEVRRAAADGPAAASLAFAAGILEAGCLGEQGRADEALAVIESLAPDTPHAAALREVHRARWRMHVGAIVEAMDVLERLLALHLDPDTATAREVRDELVVTFCFIGRIRRLTQALAALSLAAPTGHAALFGSRRGLLTEAMLAVHEGRLGDARALVDAVVPLTGQTSYLRSFVHALDVECRLMVGELDGLEALLHAVHAEAARAGHALNQCFALVTAYRLAILRGRASTSLAAGPPIVTPFWASLHALIARYHAVLHGLPPPAPPPLADPSIFGRVVAALFRSAEATLAGDLVAARVHALAALSAAREHGHVPGELDALRALADVLLLADDDGLASTAVQLRERAEAAGSRRFSAEAEWFLATLGPALHPAALEPFCALVDVAPVAARRARALLGEPAELDLVDGAVVDALRRRLSSPAIVRVAERAPESIGGAGWGLDLGARKAWLPRGRVVDLSTRPMLCRLLLAIAERGGRATKEEIVLFVWSSRDYHPMRDDKRLHVAVRKVRLLVEDDPSHPRRLVTTEDGYAFGEAEPFRLLAADGG
ncbi:hypothetical protein [Polyangium spumosum]|uniref:OmpR/PhoB-type domain-containing protein n=1 Tax=Polyangium spumosum TaxID=889282 RepID=A0A6N7PUI7_9BACT|nr:hypothetical protein [Polyangium spumosum]MRG93744.1 hypothetical protein [Polyangium spumosum]